MSAAAPDDTNSPDQRVGFRDIYRAVGESESRIKEHITLILLPITQAVADHETRLRSIEERGSDEARLAHAEAVALSLRVDAVELWQRDLTSAGIERRRIGGITSKSLAALILVVNFIVGLIVVISNLVSP